MQFENLIRVYFKNFTTLNDEEIKTIIPHFTVKKIKKGNFLFRNGEVNNNYIVVIKGALRLFYINEDFKEYSLRFAFENQNVGDLKSFVYGEKSELNLHALENTVTIEVDREKLSMLLNKFPKLNPFLINQYEEALITANQRILLNISSSAEERFDDFIARNGNYNNRLSDRHIASYIGVTPEFYSKLKKKKLREYLGLK